MCWLFFFQAEDGIRDLVRSRGLGDVYKRQIVDMAAESGGNCALTQPGEHVVANDVNIHGPLNLPSRMPTHASELYACLLYTSDAADERSSVDLGGRRIIKKNNKKNKKTNTKKKKKNNRRHNSAISRATHQK